MNFVLEIKNVSYSYHSRLGETPALQDISFNVEDGEFISIVGPSGCGKSTLLSLISGLAAPESGSIHISGNHNIGYMFQKDNLFEWRTIYGNVTLGLEIGHKKTPENISHVKTMLQTYGLEDFVHAKPSQLSGGMRQRAALIRTLALEPDILLLDEPFSALDYQTRLEVSDDIGKILRAENKTAILVTHDLSEAIAMGDRVIVLSQRPAVIKEIVPIQFSIPKRTPLAARKAPEFQDYFNRIWKELTEHETEHNQSQ